MEESQASPMAPNGLGLAQRFAAQGPELKGKHQRYFVIAIMVPVNELELELVMYRSLVG